METTATNARAIAPHSCYDQMTWRDRSGKRFDARVTAEAVKAAMLAMGTRGRFTLYSAHSATAYSINWRLAVAYLANLRGGFYSHG